MAVWSVAYTSLFGSIPLAILRAGGEAYHLAIAAVLHDVAYALVSPLSGYLGDLGRRKLLVMYSCLVLPVSAVLMLLGLALCSPAAGIASKLVLGIAAGLASPNMASLVVDYGASRGVRPEYVLARWYGVPSAIGWLAALLSAAAVAKIAGLAPIALVSSASSAVAATTLLFLREPSVTLEHSVVAVKARIRAFHERLLHARLPSAKTLVRIARSPLLHFAVSVALGFAGIGLFFSVIQAYWEDIRGLTESEILAFASLHTLASTVMYLAAHSIIQLVNPHRALALAFLARSLVFYEPLVTEFLNPRLQAALLYLQTGVTWSILNTSLNTAALTLRLGGKSTRIGIAQSSANTGLILGEVVATITSYEYGVRACFELAAIAELLAATIYMVTRPWRGR